MTVAKTYATRRAANYWVKSFGELPPGMKENATKEQEKKLKEQSPDDSPSTTTKDRLTSVRRSFVESAGTHRMPAA